MDDLDPVIPLLLQLVDEPIPAIAALPPLERRMDEPRLRAFADAARRLGDDPAMLGEILGRLAPTLRGSEDFHVARIALMAGALVERGGDPAILADALVARLEAVIPGAIGFVRKLARTEEGANRAPGSFSDDLLRLGDDDFGGLKSFLALDLLILPVMAMLCRSVAARRRARGLSSLRESLAAIADDWNQAWYLHELLSMVDELDLLAIHMPSGQGLQLRVNAVRNNFHLFTLLECVLHREGHVAGAPPEEPMCRLALGEWTREDLAANPADVSTAATWVERPWFSVRSERRWLSRSFSCSRAVFIGGEHGADEIPRFEGTAVLLLDAPPMRQLSASFFTPLHDALRSTVTVERVLPAREVSDLLGRMAAAAAARPALAGAKGCAVCSVDESDR